MAGRIGPWSGEAESCHGCISHREWGRFEWIVMAVGGGVKGDFGVFVVVI